VCINANHWAQRQAAKAGIAFTPMDNAFAAVSDVPALQAICDSFGEEQIRALLAKWLRILLHPFTEDDITAGYRYDVSIVQAETCLTQMLDRPVSSRIFLEQMIRDNLDIGRPDKVSLIFARRIHTTASGLHPASSAPGSSPTTSPRPPASSTRRRRSSSSARKGERCVPTVINDPS
jgi:hypothetical protein